MVKNCDEILSIEIYSHLNLHNCSNVNYLLHCIERTAAKAAQLKTKNKTKYRVVLYDSRKRAPFQVGQGESSFTSSPQERCIMVHVVARPCGLV